MNNRIVFYLAAVLLLGIPAIRADSSIAITHQQQSLLGIRLGYPQVASQQPLMSASATVVVPPSNQQIINAPQAGFVQQLLVTVGDKVQEGQQLAVINSPALLSLQNDYLQDLTKQQLASNSYQREKNLFAEGIIAQRRWVQTQANYQALQTETAQAQAMLTMAGMTANDLRKLRKQRLLNSLISVHAPLDGVVIERRADVGQKVEMLAPLFHLASLQQLWLEIRVPQEQVALLGIGDQVRVDNSTAVANITLIANSVDQHDQTVLVRATLSAANNSLRIGQRVNVILSRQHSTNAYRVPVSAIARSAGHSYLFVKTESGFVAKQVTVLGRDTEQVIVQAELNVKQAIAITGVVAIKAAWMGLGVRIE